MKINKFALLFGLSALTVSAASLALEASIEVDGDVASLKFSGKSVPLPPAKSKKLIDGGYAGKIVIQSNAMKDLSLIPTYEPKGETLPFKRVVFEGELDNREDASGTAKVVMNFCAPNGVALAKGAPARDYFETAIDWDKFIDDAIKNILTLNTALISMNAVELVRTEITNRMDPVLMQSRANGGSFWVTPSYRVDDSGYYWDYKTETKGIHIGADVKHNNAFYGGTVAYLKTDKKTSQIASSDTDVNYLSVAGYGAYVTDYFALQANAGWMRGRMKIESDLGGARGRVDISNVDVGMSLRLPLWRLSFIPYGKLAATFIHPERSYYQENFAVLQLPVGLKVAGDFSDGDFHVKPVLDASYVFGLADCTFKGMFDTYDITPKESVRLAAGLEAKYGKASLSLFYRYEMGRHDRKVHNAKVSVNYFF